MVGNDGRADWERLRVLSLPSITPVANGRLHLQHSLWGLHVTDLGTSGRPRSGCTFPN
jgi:hypothetical protein